MNNILLFLATPARPPPSAASPYPPNNPSPYPPSNPSPYPPSNAPPYPYPQPGAPPAGGQPPTGPGMLI